jgi:predicted  nucleic acid-binding Zn-ribbon protein
MDDIRDLMTLQDLDLLWEDLEAEGLTEELEVLGRERVRVSARVEARLVEHYERCRIRYGRGITGMRGRVCLGCHGAQPTSPVPPAAAQLLTCENCGRWLLRV